MQGTQVIERKVDGGEFKWYHSYVGFLIEDDADAAPPARPLYRVTATPTTTPMMSVTRATATTPPVPTPPELLSELALAPTRIGALDMSIPSSDVQTVPACVS